MTRLKNYDAAILCGGQSRRMGADKAFLRDAQGRLLLAVLAEQLAFWFATVFLVTNDPLKLAPHPELAPYPAVPDRHPLTGPVGAIRTALLASRRTVFVLAGDQPILDRPIIEKMADILEENGADIVLPRHGQAIEPLYAFYGPRAEPVLAQSLEEGRLAIRQSFPALITLYLDLNRPDLFQNLNTPADAQARGFTLPDLL